MMQPDGSWWSHVRAEWNALTRDVGAQAQLLWLPLLSALLLAAIFYPGIARELPVAVIDMEQSQASRALIRKLEANAGIQVALVDTQPAAGWQAMQERTVYGSVLIPLGFSQRENHSAPEPVTFYVNTQYLLIGNMLQSEVMATVMEFSASGSAGALLARRIPLQQLGGALQPVPARRSGVGNPYLNYMPFLVAAAVPCLLQIFMVLNGVRLVGREFRLGVQSTWLQLASTRPWTAFSSRFLLPAFVYTSLSVSFSMALFGWFGWPFAGSWTVYIAAHAALALASLGMGALLAVLTTNYRLASSLGAFYAAPALAFSGITFPLFAMPAFAQVWAHLIPVTAFLRLQVEQGVRGTFVQNSLPELGILLGFALVACGLSVWLLGRKTGNPANYGKL